MLYEYTKKARMEKIYIIVLVHRIVVIKNNIILLEKYQTFRKMWVNSYTPSDY